MLLVALLLSLLLGLVIGTVLRLRLQAPVEYIGARRPAAPVHGTSARGDLLRPRHGTSARGYLLRPRHATSATPARRFSTRASTKSRSDRRFT